MMIRSTFLSSLTTFRPTVWLGIILFSQTILLAWAATRHSPVIDEIGHLAAGLHHWETGTFDLYRVNPPLVRLVATIPLALIGIDIPEGELATAPPERPEFNLGSRLIDRHGDRIFWYFTLARWACIPFTLLGTVVIYAWGASLYGRPAGLISAVFWSVCPFILGNGALITPDTGAACLGLAACYLFWRWVRKPNWTSALWAGVALGLAELTKTTWVLLVPVWVASWMIFAFWNPKRQGQGWWAEIGQLAMAFFIALYVLNAGYGFEGTGQSLDQYQFVSRALTTEKERGGRKNRFEGHWIGSVPLPLPQNYVQGIDVQKGDFESGMSVYLRGEWQREGWWYYYLYGLLIKTPLGTLALFALAILSCLLTGRGAPHWRDELLLLMPAVVVLTFVSSQTGLSRHLRYILPALPFLFVWAGRVTVYAGRGQLLWRIMIGAAFLGTLASSMSVYPHSLSYFNEAAGGPKRGSEHLVNSNIDWGQDLLYLKRWLDRHPEAQPFGLVYFGYVDPRIAGIEFTLPPKGPIHSSNSPPLESSAMGPRPGWYAISVTMLRGYDYPISDGRGGREYTKGECYRYFLHFQPVASVGYSIWIYHLEPDECDRVRIMMGLPPLGPG